MTQEGTIPCSDTSTEHLFALVTYQKIAVPNCKIRASNLSKPILTNGYYGEVVESRQVVSMVFLNILWLKVEGSVDQIANHEATNLGGADQFLYGNVNDVSSFSWFSHKDLCRHQNHFLTRKIHPLHEVFCKYNNLNLLKIVQLKLMEIVLPTLYTI